MLKCQSTTLVLLVAVFGANVLLTSWNMTERYRYFDLQRCIEKPPNICNLLKHGNEEELLAEATKCPELRVRLRRVLSMSRDLSITGKLSQVNGNADMRGSSLSGARKATTSGTFSVAEKQHSKQTPKHAILAPRNNATIIITSEIITMEEKQHSEQTSNLKSDHSDEQHNIAVGNGAENSIIPSTDKYLYKNSANKERQYLLAVMVLSSPNENGKGRRQVIRETWKRGFEAADSAVTIRFVLGTAGLVESQVFSLESEHANYNDLLLLPSLKDGYQNLTLKVLNILVWADNHLHFSYLLKCDDDTYIRVGAIVSELKRRNSRQSLYWGYFSGKAKPLTRGKWRENKWFLCNNFLPFAMGGGYIISSDLVHRIARSAGGLQLYSNEDTSVGVWLSPYKAERKHDMRFNTEGISRGCSDKHLVSHKQNATDMRRKYQSLLQSAGRLQCRGEHLRRRAYEYNWHVPPSECCRKRSG